MIKILTEDFGKTLKGETIQKFTLKNAKGIKVEIINFGAIITSIVVPDKNGNFDDIVLGFNDPEDYFNSNEYAYGAVVGRFANRISGAKFNIDGKVYHVTKNDGENHIHGGNDGFASKVWEAEVIESSEFPAIKMSYLSKDREEGFPGNLQTEVIYTLTDDSLEIKYAATTDQKTVINLTQHTYFNLSGNHSQEITDHHLQLTADFFLPVNEELIPTGELRNVKDTVFDFNITKQIGEHINSEDNELKLGKGFDHCWVLNASGLRSVGNLYHPKSGRNMEIITTEPGIQFYSGNFLNGKFDTKTGGKNNFRTGLCLETQHFPDSPNKKTFINTILEPSEKFSSTTIFKFS
ncbi:aldose epimerase family protein [Chryseobacterium sp.]|uniref:aldose epimerase family protein n=1 Tax=Chryseobacterium sp. TaxID=1871047 RepID=UPI00289EDF0F|nr:aldose epimerase family protein [Chryseobacterium sp.]